jgi:hypothetical protein
VQIITSRNFTEDLSELGRRETTVLPPATVITEGSSAAPPKPAANNTAHKRQISEAIPRNERPIARQARPEPAERDTRDVVREMLKEALPQALSDAVALRISPNSAVEGVIVKSV